MCSNVLFQSGDTFTAHLAALTRADLSQPRPRVNPVLVSVVPIELQRVTAYRLYIRWAGDGLEQGQCACDRLERFTGFAAFFSAFSNALRTRTRISKKGKRVIALVSVAPLYLHSCTGTLVDFDQLWFYGRHANQYKCARECPSADVLT